MSTTKLETFLKALENVRQDLVCGVCSELCKNPVTLSTCFHLICSQHFEDLKECPTCGKSLEGCTTYVEKDLQSTITSTKKLVEIFQPYKEESINTATKKRRVLTKQNKVASQTTDKTDTAKKVPSEEKSTPKIVSKTSTELNYSRLSNVSKLNSTLEKRNNKGETALHLACRLGKTEKVIELLKQGANTNTKDNAGWTPLHEVVQSGRLDLVKLLLQYNALINVPGVFNETPLHEAMRYKHKEIVQELVKNGADVNLRNCKGETPVDVGSDEMKLILEAAKENIVQTQTVNVDKISALHTELDFDDIRVYCVSQYRTAQTKLKSLVKHHDNLHIESSFTKKVTHLVVDTEDLVCTSTLNVLQAVVNEIWVLDSEWITKSTEESLEPFEKYEVIGIGNKTYNGPRNARYNKYKQLPRLFNGCHFYLHNFNTKYEISKSLTLNKTSLSKLITDAGGIVLRRVPNPESIPESEKLVPYHAKQDGVLANCAHYIIFKDTYAPQYNMKHLKALPVGWLIECIENYQLCDP